MNEEFPTSMFKISLTGVLKFKRSILVYIDLDQGPQNWLGVALWGKALLSARGAEKLSCQSWVMRCLFHGD